jgi:hypothetical protein
MTIHVCDCCKRGFKENLPQRFTANEHGTTLEVCAACGTIYREVISTLIEEYNEKKCVLDQWFKEERTRRFNAYRCEENTGMCLKDQSPNGKEATE